jgi:thiol-disulfide isomerase/thioredoxin
MLKIPTKPAPPPIVPNDLPRPPIPGDVKLDTGPTRVPSCVLVGSHLENLALKDSKGQTWEYRKQGYGKLILLDFWGTHCLPCRETMPILNRLQNQYGARGLEVIGIALEPGQNERKEADAVNKLCTSMQVNYRQLMGRSASLDVGKQFKVEALPTLMLLSEQGDIIYHHLGRPDAAEVSHLERIIQNRLNNRAF